MAEVDRDSPAVSAAEKLRVNREKRRQKILQNAENRMRFVTGQTRILESEEKKGEGITDERVHSREESRTNASSRPTCENDTLEERERQLKRRSHSSDTHSSVNEREESTRHHRDTRTHDSGRQSDTTDHQNGTKQTPQLEFFLLSPLTRVVIVFLTGLSYHLAQGHPDILQAIWIRPSWLGQSIAYGFLSLYIPAIILVISTRFGKFLGVCLSKRTDLALTVLMYASTLVGIRVSAGKWLLWSFMLAHHVVIDLIATFFFFFLLFMNDN